MLLERAMLFFVFFFCGTSVILIDIYKLEQGAIQFSLPNLAFSLVHTAPPNPYHSL